MARAPLLLLVLLTAAALAGCSKAPPSGELGPGAAAATVDGNAVVDYVAEERPAGAIPMVGGEVCSPVPNPPVPQCVEASSHFKVHFMALPTPDGTYEVVLANATGILPLGSLAMDDNNMWELNKTVEGEDYAGAFDRLELRMGDFVFATASAAEGTNTFAVAESASAVTAAGTYRGKDLDVTVSGLPANGTFVGRLYTCDEESKLLTVAETFPVANGANQYTAPLNIADYAEFHVHVGASHINLVKSTIGEPLGCTSTGSAPASGTM